MILLQKSMTTLKISNYPKKLGICGFFLLIFSLIKPLSSQNAQIFYAATNIANFTLNDWDSQVKIIAQHGKIVSFNDAMSKFISNQKDPKYYILSISAEIKGFYSEYAPYILENKIPVIIAISQVPNEANNANILKKLIQNGAQIAVILPQNLADTPEITKAWQEFTNQQPMIFMARNGNNSAEINKITNQLQYKYGLGIHGGAISNGSNMQILPQNFLTAGNDGINNLRTRMKYYDLPAKDFLPQNLTLSEPIQNFGFTISEKLTATQKIKCQLNNHTPTSIKIIDENRIHISLPSPLGKGSHRLTCTLNTDGVNYWFSRVITIE